MKMKFIFMDRSILKGKRVYSLLLVLLLIGILVACRAAASPESAHSGKLKVVATTTIVGDVVRNIGGGAIDLSVLLPTGSDPHSFEPVPQDVARLEDAEIIFANGAGLEEFLNRIIDSAGGKDKLVSLSDGLDLIDGKQHQGETTGEHSGTDPHVWTDPTLVAGWVEKITAALSEKDPANAAAYKANASAYQKQLSELDGWIKDQVAPIPPESRKLVTDHETFEYFARRYGFETVGAVIPSFSALAEPSAQELAALEDTIRGLGVKAIFVDKSVNPALSERVGQDTGVQLVPVFSGSLSEPGGEASTYLDIMRYNTRAMVNALK